MSNNEEVAAVKDALNKKGANAPCPRCGNNSFLVYEYPTAMYMVFCDNCGLKFEHFGVILMDPSTTNTKDRDSDDARG